MNNIANDVKPERYQSRYTRGFLKMLVNDGQVKTDKYIAQFYTSKNYQERLESIKYLIGVTGKYSFPESVFADALRDFCSQVKVYVLCHYNFRNTKDQNMESCLVDIAKNDEKPHLRALALQRLSELFHYIHYDLFFSTSLLKSSKESAAGLRGLYNLDKEKAYQMAKFRTDSSSGNLDLAIAEIFTTEGNANDLNFFQVRLKARSKFNKIELIRVYLKMLGKVEVSAIIKTHIQFICKDISLAENTELVKLLIIELHYFITCNKDFMEKQDDLLLFFNKTIDALLEKGYIKTKIYPGFISQ